MSRPLPFATVSPNLALAFYYATLGVLMLASFFPQHRIWSVNWWAYYSGYVPWVLLAIGAIAPIAVLALFRRDNRDTCDDESTGSDDRMFFIFVSVMVVLFGLAFYFLRARAHFLGDGYQLISRLADGVPSVKMWDQGISLLIRTVFSVMRGESEIRALHAFQVVSITSGVALMAAVGYLSHVLFQHNRKRCLFFMGLISSGYMLLYFGYVENYSPVMAIVLVYCLTGLASLKDRLSPLWAGGLFLLAVSLHVFAVALLPSLIYLLFIKSRYGRRLQNVKSRSWYLIFALLAVAASVTYYHLYSNYYFFTFALLPPLPDRFTVEDDWLFSMKHIADMANLMLLLLPGLPVLGVMFVATRDRRLLRRPEFRFLILLLLSTLGAVYIFNPGIGMPRNWDLFSIAGPPMAVFGFYFTLQARAAERPRLVATVLAICLGFLVLLPRAVSQVYPEIARTHFKHYATLDKLRNRNAWMLLLRSAREEEDTKALQQELMDWKKGFPEETILLQGKSLRDQGQFASAAVYFKQAIELNPIYHDAWSHLGEAYLRMKRYDSAMILLKIADGLNPYNSGTLNNMGSAYFYRRDFERAEECWIRAAIVDTSVFQPLFNLTRMYQALKQEGKYFDALVKLASHAEAPHSVVRELADYYLRKGQVLPAAATYRIALRKGLDTAYVKDLIVKYPALNHILDTPTTE